MRRLRAQQAVAYTHAQLAGVAVNNPRKMPRFAKVFPDPRRGARPMSDAEMLESMRAWSRHVSATLPPAQAGRQARPADPTPDPEPTA